MTVELLNVDCMEYMKSCKDNEFDLAICDPPYGINMAQTLGRASKKTKGFKFKAKQYEKKSWDSETPRQEYFDEIIRVSKKQIIWGANYFTDKLPIIKNYIFWYKKGLSVDTKFNEGEMAYLSKGRTRMVDIWWNGFGVINSGEDRTHPTQKPVKLYEWQLSNYAEKGQRILDTHLGSGSSAIAAHYFGCDFVGCEIDEDYFKVAKARFDNETKQETLF